MEIQSLLSAPPPPCLTHTTKTSGFRVLCHQKDSENRALARKVCAYSVVVNGNSRFYENFEVLCYLQCFLCLCFFCEFSMVCKGVANSMDVRKLELQSIVFPTTACFGGMDAL
jgi:hypothetical protein